MLYLQNINEIAETIISELKSVKSPFLQVSVVCHNTKVAQWFKAYYLKHNGEVMMNVKFITLSVFINDIVNPNREFKIMGREQFRAYIIKALTDSSLYSYDASNPVNPINYIFRSSGKLNGMNLYEFADRLATLFINYECDLEIDDITGWEKDLYDKVIDLAEKDKYTTTKVLWEKSTEKKAPENPVYIINNSYISNLFTKIIEKECGENVSVYGIEANSVNIPEEATITPAPSKLREVEALHTEICKLIKDNKDLRFNDILVYAPDIREYANSIRRVFLQDDIEYPSVPFRIVGECREQKDMIDSISLLTDIANKKFFTRNDFHKFVKNPMIMWIKNIDEEEIQTWMSVIIKTNTHRNGKTGKNNDDWEYLKNRLLMSVLVSESGDIEYKTNIGGLEYLPYNEMGLDSNSMNKMLDIIDSLQAWLVLFEGKDLTETELDNEQMNKIKCCMDTFYSAVNSNSEETNYLYEKVSGEFDRAISMYENIPANTLMLLLKEAPLRYSVNPADMFTGGVTFMSINSDDIVSAPYIFAIGMSSENFPRTDIKSELDLSKNHKASKELDESALSNICSNAEKIVFSYVSSNLKTEEELFPCSYLRTLAQTAAVPLDEKRDYGELFTRKEFKNKSYFNNIGKDYIKKLKTKPEEVISTELKLSDIKNFFDHDTFRYKFEKLMSKDYEEEEKILEEYEPIDMSALEKYSISRDLATCTNSECEMKDSFLLNNRIPDGEIGDVWFDTLYDATTGIRECIIPDFTCKNLPPLDLSYSDTKGKIVKWTLNCNIDVYKKENGVEMEYFDPSRKVFSAYAYSLMDIASKKDTGTVYNVRINGSDSMMFNTTVAKCRNTLNELYFLMTDYSDTQYMDLDYIKEIRAVERSNEKGSDIPLPIPQSLRELLLHINSGYWKYFNDRYLVNQFTELGYTDSNIKDKFYEYYEKIVKLIPDELL